jgi:hypothetical protein
MREERDTYGGEEQFTGEGGDCSEGKFEILENLGID